MNALKKISFALSFAFSVFLTWDIVHSLSVLKTSLRPEIYLMRIGLALAGYFFPIIGGWLSLRFMGGVFFAAFSAIMVFFVEGVTASPVFVWFLLEYAGLCYLFFRTDLGFEDLIAGIRVDREKYQNEKNDLDVSHKAKGEGISMLFEKYSTYYNLRKLAEELAKSLSVTELADIIVKHTMDLIARGAVAILSFTNSESPQLSMLAFKTLTKGSSWDPSRYSGGDLFDLWVVKNQRRLIVTDAQQDFRFDVSQAVRLADCRSLIMAPILHERRVIGTVRVNSDQPDIFSNDDLRLLDIIAVLASSALSNARLFEQTQELAIKDSLTQVYVRRYFFDRLKDEHRRSLMTHRPLSILMCDLDHFKACNDRYGHGVGDLMLTEFAQLLKHSGENAIVGRYGGEEFALILPETPKEEARQFAEQLRKSVEEKEFMVRRQRIAMTVSIGVSSLPGDALDLEMLVHKADQALYQAKREGRNRVC